MSHILKITLSTLAESDASSLIVEVADNGDGIAPENVAKIYDPFFTTKEIGSGSGLGLPMVQGFAAQSGGAVQIRSRPGEGTTVELWLPRALEPPSEAVGGDQSLLVVSQDAQHPIP